MKRLTLSRCLFLFIWLFVSSQAWADISPLVDAEDKRQLATQAIHQFLHSKFPAKRVRAALFLGRMQHVNAVPMLLPMAQDKHPDVRAMAAFSLGQLAWVPAWTVGYTQKIVAQLQRLLSDKNVAVRKAAIEALGKYAPTNLPGMLRQILKGKKAVLQAEALLALFRYQLTQQKRARAKKPASQPTSRPTSRPTTMATSRPTSRAAKPKGPQVPFWVITQMERLTLHKDERVRRNLAYFFARIKDNRGSVLLISLTRDSDEWVRYFAMLALKKLQEAQALELGVLGTRDKSYIVRVASIQYMEAIKQAHRLSKALVKDPSFHVRAALAKAWGSATQAQPIHLQALYKEDASVAVQAAALISLAKLNKDSALPLVQKALTHKSWVIREAAVKATKYLTKKLSLLLLAQKDKAVQVRAAALMALGSVQKAAAYRAIQQGLRSNQLAERGYAVYALAKQKEKSGQLALLWKTYQNSRASKWIELREELLDMIAKSKESRATSYLQEALRDPSPSVAAKAKSWLLKRGIVKFPNLSKPKWSFSPHRNLTFSKNPVVVLETNKGKLTIECYAKAAPIHVANFVGRVRKGLYNGLIWHRVISNFVIQGGDPDGTGWGDGGYQLRAEINRKRYQRGTLGMPRAQGWNTGSVQLFFTHTPTPHLDGRYTVFGQITKGLDVMDRIEVGDRIIKGYVK